MAQSGRTYYRSDVLCPHPCVAVVLGSPRFSGAALSTQIERHEMKVTDERRIFELTVKCETALRHSVDKKNARRSGIPRLHHDQRNVAGAGDGQVGRRCIRRSSRSKEQQRCNGAVQQQFRNLRHEGLLTASRHQGIGGIQILIEADQVAFRIDQRRDANCRRTVGRRFAYEAHAIG